MKKLYRKGTVHPTPPAVSDQLLSFFPAAILTLVAALSQEEREVLAYLISCSSANFSDSHHKKTPSAATTGSSKGGAADLYPACFGCYCFRCYMSYWVKWDSSPNRQLIHEIIDAFEESLLKESRKEKNKRERRTGKSVTGKTSLEFYESKKSKPSSTKQDFNFTESNSATEHGIDGVGGENSVHEEEEKNEEQEDLEKGPVRRFVNFLGEKIWSVWG